VETNQRIRAILEDNSARGSKEFRSRAYDGFVYLIPIVTADDQKIRVEGGPR
jgi:hypothetical protein